MIGIGLRPLLLVALAGTPAALAVQVVENEFFTATIPSNWEVRREATSRSGSHRSLHASAPRAGTFSLSVAAKASRGPRTTVDAAFLSTYDVLTRTAKVEHEESINQASHRKGVGVKLVTVRGGANYRVVSITRIFVWEESGRICVAQSTIGDRTRESAERRYAAFIPLWEETVGALAIHPPRT